MRIIRLIMLTLLAIIGAALLGLGGTSQHLAAQAEAAHPPTGSFVTADGRRMQVIRMGPASPAGRPPLVFIHGAFGQAQDFAVSLMPETALRFDSIAIDRPGHGYSDRRAAQDSSDGPITPDLQAAALRATLTALGVTEKPILIGFSYGGAVALAWALAHPDEIAGLLLISPATHPWPTPIALTYQIAGMPLLGPLMVNTIVTPVGMIVKDEGAAGVFQPAAVPANFAKAPLALTVRPKTYAANAEDVRVLKPFLAEQSLHYGDLKLPLIVMASDVDNSTSPRLHSQAIVKQVAGAEFIELKGGGHPLHFSRPSEVLAAIDRLAARIAP